jgi:flagellar biosynthetic protein FliR
MPSALETFLVSRLVVFALVLARTSALVMTAPIFGSVAIPRQARVLLAVTMSLLVTPLYLNTTLPPLENLPEFARLLLNEVLIGLLLGLGVTILFSGIQVAGQIVSQMSGLSLADVFNPGFDDEASVFSQLFYFLTLAVFVAVGGHRILTQALLETFAWAPPGHAALGENFVEVVTSIATQSFALGIRASAPLLVALTLATLVLGLISRTLPQINIIAIGFGLSSMILLGVLFLSIGAIAWAFQDPIVSILQQLQETVTYANY